MFKVRRSAVEGCQKLFEENLINLKNKNLVWINLSMPKDDNFVIQMHLKFSVMPLVVF